MRPLRTGDRQTIGGYQVRGRLGLGAMGEVFYAQSRSGRPIAIKVIRRELADSPEFRQRFAREVAAMKTGRRVLDRRGPRRRR